MTTSVQESSDNQSPFSFVQGNRSTVSERKTGNDTKNTSSKDRLEIFLRSFKPTSTTYKTDPDFLCSLPFF